MIRKGIIITKDGMRLLGGPGSGNFDHAGIPGQQGGSAPGGGGGDVDTDIGGKRTVGKDFEGEDFSGKDLSQASCKNCTFSNADMKNVKIEYGQFEKSYFVSTDLSGADLSKSMFQNCYFGNADLRGVNFTGAAILDCDFDGAQFDEGTNFTGATVQGMHGNFYPNGMITNFAPGSYYEKDNYS